jgi:hypothetical protein
MDIAGWLRGRGLGQCEPVFRDNDIDGAVLPSLTTEDLEDLGITSVGHRHRLPEAIAAPREGDEPAGPTAVAYAAPSRLVMAGDRGSRAGKAFENAVLIAPATGETRHRLPVRSTGGAYGREGRAGRRCGRVP